MPGCGISPSPAISFEVSTMTTRLCRSSASTRAISRSIVVLPTPGLPSSRMLLPDSTMSRMMAMVPKTARPTRQVRPIDPALAVADRRDAVQRALDAGAVVVAELADAAHHVVDVFLADGDVGELVSRARGSAPPARAPGPCTTSSRPPSALYSRTAALICGGRASSSS